jgi:hypothetical protein
MKLPLLLYNFAKVYIPAALLLVMTYEAIQYASENYTNVFNLNSLPFLQKQAQTPQQPSATVMEKKTIAPKSPTQQQPTAKYNYLVELTSGGSMNAEHIEVKGNIVTIFAADGYEVKLPKRDIRKVIKVKLQ